MAGGYFGRQARQVSQRAATLEIATSNAAGAFFLPSNFRSAFSALSVRFLHRFGCARSGVTGLNMRHHSPDGRVNHSRKATPTAGFAVTVNTRQAA